MAVRWRWRRLVLLILLLVTVAAALTRGQEDASGGGGGADIRVLEVRTDVQHRFARTRVYSVIANRAREPREVTFRAVLPDAAFISALAITSGGRVTQARVQERTQARDAYDAATRQGRTAARAEAASSARDASLFTVAVHVGAGQQTAFNLTYEQLLARERGRYRLRHMLDPGQVVPQLLVEVRIKDALPLTGVRAASLRALDNEVDPSAVDGGDEPLATVERPAAGEAVVRWRPDVEAQASLGGDGHGAGLQGLLEIQYDVERGGAGGSELVIGDGGYFVHFFAPPEDQMTPLPKHAVFVLDTSGSMSGSKIRQLKEAMAAILSELRAADAFSLEMFDSEVSVWSSASQSFVEVRDPQELPADVVVDASRAAEAQDAVNRTTANGGTHMWSALRAAYALVREGRRSPSPPPRRSPLLFFLTDGQPNGPHSSLHELQALVEEERAGAGAGAPLYCLAFGEQADFAFLKRLALRGGGFARRVYAAADAALQLRRLYATVASPLLTNVSFVYADDQVDAASLTRTAFPVHLSGAELAVAGRVRSPAEGGDLSGARVEGDVAEGGRTASAATARRLPSATFVERLWAYLTIRELLERGQGDDDAARQRALQLALRYSFVTPLTSLVAVDPAPAPVPSPGGGAQEGRQEGQPTAMRMELRDAHVRSPSPPPSGLAPYGSPPSVGSGAVARSFMAMPLTGPDLHGSHRRGRKKVGPMSAQRSSMMPTGRSRDGTSSNPSEKVPLSAFQWLSDGVAGNGSHVFIAAEDAASGVIGAYLVAEPTDLDSAAAQRNCTVAMGGVQRAGSCVPLAHCALQVFARSVQLYRQAFCVIATHHAGACCPTGWSALP